MTIKLAFQGKLPLGSLLEAVSIELESDLQSSTLFFLKVIESSLGIYFPQTPL